MSSSVDSTYISNTSYKGGNSNVIGLYATLQQTSSSATIAGKGGVTAIPPVKTYSNTGSLLLTIPVYGGIAANVPNFQGADSPQYGTLQYSYGNVETCNTGSAYMTF